MLSERPHGRCLLSKRPCVLGISCSSMPCLEGDVFRALTGHLSRDSLGLHHIAVRHLPFLPVCLNPRLSHPVLSHHLNHRLSLRHDRPGRTVRIRQHWIRLHCLRLHRR